MRRDFIIIRADEQCLVMSSLILFALVGDSSAASPTSAEPWVMRLHISHFSSAQFHHFRFFLNHASLSAAAVVWFTRTCSFDSDEITYCIVSISCDYFYYLFPRITTFAREGSYSTNFATYRLYLAPVHGSGSCDRVSRANHNDPRCINYG